MKMGIVKNSKGFIIGSISVLLILFAGCKQKVNSESEYFKIVNNPQYGCIAGKNQGRVAFVMKYLHPEYLAYKECINGEKDSYDSLKEVYSQSRTFIFSLRNSDMQAAYDVLYTNADSPIEYNRRLRLIQYDMTTSFYMKDNEVEIYPRLCTTENNYGLSAERRIILVFDKKMCPKRRGKIKIYYDDKLFGNELSEFVFDIANMDNKLTFGFI